MALTLDKKIILLKQLNAKLKCQCKCEDGDKSENTVQDNKLKEKIYCSVKLIEKIDCSF